MKSALSVSAKLWIALGGVAVLGLLVMGARELPAIRRELRLLRM
jgi:hypothetical protein